MSDCLECRSSDEVVVDEVAGGLLCLRCEVAVPDLLACWRCGVGILRPGNCADCQADVDRSVAAAAGKVAAAVAGAGAVE